MRDFEKWLREVCFQKPTPEAYDLARDAWIESRKQEREACAKSCEELQFEIGECPELAQYCADSIRDRKSEV